MTTYQRGLLLVTKDNRIVPIVLVKKQGEECEYGDSEVLSWQPGIITTVITDNTQFSLPEPVEKISTDDFCEATPPKPSVIGEAS